MKLRYKTLTEALGAFLLTCRAVTDGTIGEVQHPFVEMDIKIHLHQHGSGYIHALGRDSETIDFETVE